MKFCKYCSIEQPLEQFSPHPHTKDCLSNKCKTCVNNYNKNRWRQMSDVERQVLYAKKRQNLNRLVTDRNKTLKRKYGITVEHYEQMLKHQNGVCKICKSLDPSGRRLAVDHCHTTGAVRGLLCPNCNTALGRIEQYLKNKVPWDEYLNDAA
jgi:hypothetical protein